MFFIYVVSVVYLFGPGIQATLIQLSPGVALHTLPETPVYERAYPFLIHMMWNHIPLLDQEWKKLLFELN
jgi:hypothetical protein